jgi:23S rRNA (cytosine1962-C5)-methyltransferase
VVKDLDSPVSTLNLFAYSGGSSLAMASAGAEVCHLDSAKGMIEWGKQNLELNPDIPSNIRWITDDVNKFTAREIRRGRKYNGIVLDPPSFGRGAQGQIWKIEESIMDLLKSCRELIDLSKSHFVLFSCHSQGFTPASMSRALKDIFPGAGEPECGEMLIPESSGKMLPAGAFARFFAKR